jgi:hypothetical protein
MSENSYCPNCSKPIAQDDVFCRFCGVGLTKSEIKDKNDADTAEIAADYLLDKIKIEPREWKESEEQKDSNDSPITNNRLRLTIAFLVIGIVAYLLINPSFLGDLLHPTYTVNWGPWYDPTSVQTTYANEDLKRTMPGFIVTIILMSVVGFIVGSVVDNQTTAKK